MCSRHLHSPDGGGAPSASVVNAAGDLPGARGGRAAAGIEEGSGHAVEPAGQGRGRLAMAGGGGDGDVQRLVPAAHVGECCVRIARD